MSSARNPNSTLHFEIRFDDGERLREKCRNTLGGHINMMKRLEKRFGARVRSETKGSAEDRRYVVGGQLVEGWELTTDWVEGGRRFELVELIEIAPGLFAEST